MQPSRSLQLLAPDDGICRVALVSNIPMRPVNLRVQEAHGRCVAALVDFGTSPDQVESILIVGVYLRSGDEAAATCR